MSTSSFTDRLDSLFTLLTTFSLTRSSPPQSVLSRIFTPDLPPLLAPLPGLFRGVALLIVAPILVIALIDFAWYAVFRTLGLSRRRVRVPRTPGSGKARQIQLSDYKEGFHFPTSRDADPGASSPGSTRAPLLSPGAYDADALLRHRARSASAASADAEMEWVRTGGAFARVSTVRAAAAASGTTTPEPDPNVSPPESPRSAVLKNTWARAHGVGVDGPMGYFDTDAEESGTESGRSSPVASFGRANGSRAKRAGGFGGGALGFTPVTPSAHTSGLPGAASGSTSPTWESAAAAAAADLEPELQ